MHFDYFKELTQEELSAPVLKHVKPIKMALPHHITVEEAVGQLHEQKLQHKLSFFYVTDDEGKLLGVLTPRDLLYSSPKKKLREILSSEVVTVSDSHNMREALKAMTQCELRMLPVVSPDGKLLGTIEVPMHNDPGKKPTLKKSKLPKEVFQLIELSIASGEKGASVKEFRSRMPWLFCNIASGLLCAAIASFYQDLLNHFIVIAMFIPLVLSLGESVAVQSMSLSMQFLHFGKVPWKRVFNRVSVEWKSAVLLGAACSLVVVAFYFFCFKWGWPMAAIGSSILLSMIAATLFGTILPVLIHFTTLDPKIASGPAVLMITDIAVSLIYFGLSRALIL